MKKRIVVVTDGDQSAWRAARRAVVELGLGFVDITEGNPTRATLAEVEEALVASPYEVVVVLADDGGTAGIGPGERLIEALARSPAVEIVAAVAVASWAHQESEVRVDESVTAEGSVVATAVDKEGRPVPGKRLSGDTVGVLRRLCVPIVGVGDIGEDGHACGVPALRKALAEALRLAAPTAIEVEEPMQ